MAIIMYVECVDKPYEDLYVDITIGKRYEVKWVSYGSYQIIDDAGKERFYDKKYFKVYPGKGLA